MSDNEYVQIIVLGNNAGSVFDFALKWAQEKGWNVEGQDNVARIVVSVTGPPIIETRPPPTKHWPPGTNQDVINLFNSVFGSATVNGQPAFIDALMRAQMISIAQSRSSNYAGLPVEDLPGLTTAEKDRLIRAL